MFAELLSQSYQKPLLGNVHLISTYVYILPLPFYGGNDFRMKRYFAAKKKNEIKGRTFVKKITKQKMSVSRFPFLSGRYSVAALVIVCKLYSRLTVCNKAIWRFFFFSPCFTFQFSLTCFITFRGFSFTRGFPPPTFRW